MADSERPCPSVLSCALAVHVILSTPSRAALIAEAETGCSWIPGLAVLARNDGCVVFVIPAKAGIQGVWDRVGILFLSSEAIFAVLRLLRRGCSSQ